MSKVPIGSAAPPKRRKKNQSKTRRSRANGRNKSDTVEEVSTPAEKILNEGSRNQVAYGSTDRSGTTAIPLPIRSVAPTNDTQPFSKEISPQSIHIEAKNTPKNFFPLDGCGSPFIDIWDECFPPETPGNMVQAHIAPDFIWNPFQNERLRTVKSEEEEMGTITAMDLDRNTPAPFPDVDFNFGHTSTASSPYGAFDFNLDMEIDLALPVANFPLGNWLVPDFPSAFTGPITTDQDYTVSSQLQQTGFCTVVGQDTISNLDGNKNDEIAILFNSSLYDQPDEQNPLSQENATKPLINSCYDPIEYGANIAERNPPAQAASSGKGPRKRSSSRDDECDGVEDTILTNCGRLPRDNGGERLLACPFFKKDPQRYQDCGKYTLRRIKDVKQHIYRLHCKPELYCSRCFENFKCSNERDHHIREGGCTLKEVPNRDDVISDNQRKELKECGSRGKSKQQQWMELWDVIFPGAKRPRSPHVEDGQGELLSSLRSYWDGNADEIITKSICKRETECLNSSWIREIVDIILDHFETNPANWDLATNGKKGGAPQPLLASDNSGEYILSDFFLMD